MGHKISPNQLLHRNGPAIRNSARSFSFWVCQGLLYCQLDSLFHRPHILNQVMPSPPTPARRPEVHGHRGCRGLRPENTLPAFLHALSLGVDVLELDVVISADGQVVVSHEPWLNPTICRGINGEILGSGVASRVTLYQLPYATIRQCDCGQRHSSFPQQVPQPACKPLLREIFTAIESAVVRLGRPPVGYSIEIKSTLGGDHVFHPAPSDFFALVLAELLTAGVLPRTTLLCFDTRILQVAHQQPGLATCLLLENGQPWLESVQQLGFVPAALGPDFLTVTPAAVHQLRTAHPSVRLVPWTVNSLAAMQHLRSLGVDGITTDYPDRLLTLLAGDE